MFGSSLVWNWRLRRFRVIDVNDPGVEHELEVSEDEKCVHEENTQEGAPPMVVDEKSHVMLWYLGICIIGT